MSETKLYPAPAALTQTAHVAGMAAYNKLVAEAVAVSCETSEVEAGGSFMAPAVLGRLRSGGTSSGRVSALWA